MKYYLAIDLGASSGRHIVGWVEDGDIKLKEVHRFYNGVVNSEKGLLWDFDALFREIKTGIGKAVKEFGKIESLSIDTWGVDYVLMDGDKVIPPFYAYRNDRVNSSIPEVHKILPFSELYARTGMQFATFNTIYQLYEDKMTGRLDKATDFLMVPSYFSYLLTGVKKYEYTECSTTGMLNAETGDFDPEIIEKLGLPKKIFHKLYQPGTEVGFLKPEIAEEVGGQMKVVLCASHDTGSAFEAVDCPDDAIFISSGTWSLMGVKIKNPNTSMDSFGSNFTNEGGVGYIRYLKNIMGMWIANQVQKHTSLTLRDIDTNIVNSTYTETFDVNHSSLAAPENMKEAVLKLLSKNPPKDDIDLFASIYRSLAVIYKRTAEELEHNLHKKFNYIYIVGGGAKNKYLNNLVEEITGKKVVALPIEATAIGNIKIQAKQ